MRLVAAPDKFRGTAAASDIAKAIGEAAWEAGWDSLEVPVADGGEGLLDAFGGANRSTVVSGPDRRDVDAPWIMRGDTAIIEMAAASGLELVGGPRGNDPIVADTTGTGQLMLAAAAAGAKRIIVGLGGSASTDGGLGAVRAVADPARLASIELLGACDVDVPFAEAASLFAAQKGASPAQVKLLARRLARTAQIYRNEFGVDVSDSSFGGAAGGLGGGLVVLGATLLAGFDLVAEEVELETAIGDADLVITGEGFVDEASYFGKVVGGVSELAAEHGTAVLVVAGDVFDGVETRAETYSLAERFGPERAKNDVMACVREVVAERLADWGTW